jgi:hypothetical protein
MVHPFCAELCPLGKYLRDVVRCAWHAKTIAIWLFIVKAKNRAPALGNPFRRWTAAQKFGMASHKTKILQSNRLR